MYNYNKCKKLKCGSGRGQTFRLMSGSARYLWGEDDLVAFQFTCVHETAMKYTAA
jgi:hypothetical protein